MHRRFTVENRIKTKIILLVCSYCSIYSYLYYNYTYLILIVYIGCSKASGQCHIRKCYANFIKCKDDENNEDNEANANINMRLSKKKTVPKQKTYNHQDQMNIEHAIIVFCLSELNCHFAANYIHIAIFVLFCYHHHFSSNFPSHFTLTLCLFFSIFCFSFFLIIINF